MVNEVASALCKKGILKKTPTLVDVTGSDYKAKFIIDNDILTR